MTTATRTSTTLDLRKLVEEIPLLAAASGLNPLAAVPEPGDTHVLLEEDLVNAEDFIALAHRCGARVLYYGHDAFTAEDFVLLDDADPLADGPTVEQQLSPEAARRLRKLRKAASRRTGHVTAVVMCFMAEGLPHMWIARAAWHTELTAERDLFLAEHECAQESREEDDNARRAAEQQRMAVELADDPDFRAATKRTHHHDIATTAYPPPDTTDADELKEHQWLVRGATRDAIELVDAAARRLYAALGRDLDALAQEIASAGITQGATTVKARTLLVTDFLLAKTDGYSPPARFIDRLMLRVQMHQQPTRRAPLAEPLPLG
ncbi:hypothetical protein [Streptomyces sp. RerS4]|uniref:hypothetical protein n=1 Tax=Streptomyces sp. RerS4 TaxID=2942449 RepID=UPI00201C28D2|nr:hypothetical protein [Streptomyces sp. RerS4]UQW99167.1 hypothetical protein M4D82_00390 [Streptomyces sp. RerS4]